LRTGLVHSHELTVRVHGRSVLGTRWDAPDGAQTTTYLPREAIAERRGGAGNRAALSSAFGATRLSRG